VRSRVTVKYILTVIAIIVADFLATVLSVQLTSDYFVKSYIEDEIYVQQNRVYDAIDPLVYRTLSAYFEMFTSSNVSELRAASPENRETYYEQMYSEAINSDDIFGGSASFIDGNYYSSGSNSLIVTTADENVVDASLNQIDYVSTYIDGSNGYVIFGKKVIDPTDASKTIGTTFFYIHHEIIADIIKEIAGDKGYSFILDGSGTIVAHQESEYAGYHVLDTSQFMIDQDSGYRVETIDGERSLVSVKKLVNLADSYGFDWRVISVESYSALFSNLDNLKVAIIGISLAILALTIAFSVILSQKMIAPLAKLREEIASFDPIKPKKLVTRIGENDEMYQLEKSYEDMTVRIHDLMEKNKEDSDYQRKLELDSLQMQINPHFLYNTLDAIAWMAKIKKEDDIEHLVMTLARFFRLSLHKGDKFISVNEEIELVKCFVEIEIVRFPDRFDVSYDISKEAEGCEILKLLVQPLVENAIKHGLAPLKRKGRIDIKASVEGNDLLIAIDDDGIGFVPSPDLLIKDEKNKDANGYGLKNVNDRIKLEYGEEYGLTVTSAPGKGTRALIRLAARRS
jgi:two-component system sensor histidine kinase YesM